jgi:aspartate/methionine/tyrosine aminotransferase
MGPFTDRHTSSSIIKFKKVSTVPYHVNPVLRAVTAPPIADAQQWIAGRTFPVDKPLLDVSQAVPNYAPAASLQAYLAQQVLQPGTALYTQIAGLPSLRMALAESLSQEYAGQIDADHIAITAGCNEAFSVAMMALASAGDEVLLPLPYYFNHQMWLQTRRTFCSGALSCARRTAWP